MMFVERNKLEFRYGYGYLNLHSVGFSCYDVCEIVSAGCCQNRNKSGETSTCDIRNLFFRSNLQITIDWLLVNTHKYFRSVTLQKLPY